MICVCYDKMLESIYMHCGKVESDFFVLLWCWIDMHNHIHKFVMCFYQYVFGFIVIVCCSLAILTYCMFVSNIIIIQNSLFTFPIEYFICVNPYHNTINFSWTLVKSLIIKIFVKITPIFMLKNRFYETFSYENI